MGLSIVGGFAITGVIVVVAPIVVVRRVVVRVESVEEDWVESVEED